MSDTEGFSARIELKEELDWDDAPVVHEVNRGSLQPRDALAMPLSELLHSADKELLQAAVASGDATYSGKILNTNDTDVNTDVILNQKLMLAMLEQQSNNQIKIMKQLSRHEGYFKELRSNINNITPIGNLDEPKHSPIQTLEELEAIEENLKDKEFRKSYIRAKSQMVPLGLGRLAMCYRLLEAVITREVLAQCSWMGNCWDKKTNNTSFRKFQWVRMTFLRIIIKVHPGFSQLECDQFFKAMIKSAKAASKRKLQSPRTEDLKSRDGQESDDVNPAPDISETVDDTTGDAEPPPACEEQLSTHSAPSSPASIDNGPDIEFLALNASTAPSDSRGTSAVLHNQKIMLAFLEQQSKNQAKIMKQLGQHEEYLQELRSHINKPIYSTEPEYNDELEYPPVRNKQELEILEDNLNNADFRRSYMETKSSMFPADCQIGGLAVCYKLIDEITSREFLTECSWTGNSRDETADKTPFKYFSKVRATFLAIVKRADPSFTQLECDNFLKMVIKNSRARSCSRMLRTSAPKRRKKRPRTG